MSWYLLSDILFSRNSPINDVILAEDTKFLSYKQYCWKEQAYLVEILVLSLSLGRRFSSNGLEEVDGFWIVTRS